MCERIHRAINGSLWLGDAWIDATRQNIGDDHWKGIDLAWNWGLDAWGGGWDFNLLGTYMLKKETTDIANDPDSTYDCVGVISYRCWPAPKWRHTAIASYD